MGLPLRDNRYHTYADYLCWPDTMRFELIDGVAYAMGPAPARVHQELLGAMFAQVYAALEARPCRPYVAPFDVRLRVSAQLDGHLIRLVEGNLARKCRWHAAEGRQSGSCGRLDPRVNPEFMGCKQTAGQQERG